MSQHKSLTINYDVNGNFISINSDDFNITYGNGLGGHGLQCSFVGKTEKYKKTMELTDEIADKVRELYRLNNGGKSE